MRRAVAIVVIVAPVLFVLFDVQRPAERQWSAAAALGGIGIYQRYLSGGWTIVGVTCRFAPSCSQYASSAIREYGIVRGGWLSARRLVRCGPWTPAGTLDPPP